MKFNISDKVSFLNEKGNGVIVKILNKTLALVLTEEGFEIPFNINELIIYERNDLERTLRPDNKKPKESSTKKTKSKNNFSKKPKIKSGQQEKEIDLHIEELLENTIGLSSGQKLEIQLEHVQKELDKAFSGNIRKIIFIHGVGSGRLKQEIHSILKTYNNLEFYDASYKKYGFGATEVVIR